MKPSRPDPTATDFDPLIALFNARRYAELESQVRNLLVNYPDAPFAWQLLGGALQMQGKDALAAFQKTAALSPNDAGAHFNLAVAFKKIGQLERAVAAFQQAIRIKPGLTEAYRNLGLILSDLKQFNKIIALFNEGKFVEAEKQSRALTEQFPEFAAAWELLGNCLHRQGKRSEALLALLKAAKMLPNDAEAHYNLGITQRSLGQLSEAVASYQRAIALKPDWTEALNNLGDALKDFGQHDESLTSFKKALALKPDYFQAHSNLLFGLNYASRLNAHDCLQEALRYGEQVAKGVSHRFTAWRCDPDPQKLRVGLVSGDLRSHPVGHFLESLIRQTDPSRIELIAYTNHPGEDDLTARIKPCFSQWRQVFGLDDQAAAQLIYDDGVHLLLDLSGHTSHNRLPVFAWKPAPVQASWLGYFATTGMAEIDYLLADETGVPENRRSHFSETIWYLPDTRLCFTAPNTDLPVAPPPGLGNGHITFGCFQNLAKVGDEVLAVWGRIFTALPGARLRLASKQLGDATVAAQLYRRLQQQGIAGSRVSMHGSLPRRDYLASHAQVDILLDTFPYPGGTTTCEALWMGVPTLTLAGESLLARQGASILNAAGLPDWIARDEADYVAKAVQFAGDLPKLATLRAGLREQVRVSPLFDAPRFARNFERALWGMWQARQPSSPVARQRTLL